MTPKIFLAAKSANPSLSPLHVEHVQAPVRHRQVYPRAPLTVALSHRETRLGKVVGHLDRTAARSASLLVRVDEVFQTGESGFLLRVLGD